MHDHDKDKGSIIPVIREIKSQLTGRQTQKLQLNRLERIVGKLEQYEKDCDECSRLLQVFKEDVIPKLKSLDEGKRKEYQRYVRGAISHLLKEHKLVTDGYYTGLYLMFGTALGLLFGMAFENTALGLPIGIGIGIAIGSGLDAMTRKKGNAI